MARKDGRPSHARNFQGCKQERPIRRPASVPAWVRLLVFQQRALYCRNSYSDSRRYRRLRLGIKTRRRLRFLNVDGAFEVRSVLDGNPCRSNVPSQRRTLAKVGAVGGAQVSIHLTMHNHIPCLDVCTNASIGADRQALATQRNGTFDFAVDIQIFAARKFALNNYRLPNGSEVHATRRFAAEGLRRSW